MFFGYLHFFSFVISLSHSLLYFRAHDFLLILRDLAIIYLLSDMPFTRSILLFSSCSFASLPRDSYVNLLTMTFYLHASPFLFYLAYLSVYRTGRSLNTHSPFRGLRSDLYISQYVTRVIKPIVN
jgi:hypothetical protein